MEYGKGNCKTLANNKKEKKNKKLKRISKLLIEKILAKLPKRVRRDEDIWSLVTGTDLDSIVSVFWLK